MPNANKQLFLPFSAVMLLYLADNNKNHTKEAHMHIILLRMYGGFVVRFKSCVVGVGVQGLYYRLC